MRSLVGLTMYNMDSFYLSFDLNHYHITNRPQT